ncbi:MAG: GlsB/YeaQ/YmgE family stress response membrane protein [Acidimicrobiia bacterium]|nr:GlsB/YeaQ/YmgE family stress response membrane protein [Acidimicrobiia bacterium]
MFILTMIATGMALGALAQLVLGRASTRIDWTMALATGIAGSFLGGLLANLLTGDGLELRPSGLIGTVIGAVLLTAVWTRLDPAKADESRRSQRRGPDQR